MHRQSLSLPSQSTIRALDQIPLPIIYLLLSLSLSHTHIHEQHPPSACSIRQSLPHKPRVHALRSSLSTPFPSLQTDRWEPGSASWVWPLTATIPMACAFSLPPAPTPPPLRLQALGVPQEVSWAPARWCRQTPMRTASVKGAPSDGCWWQSATQPLPPLPCPRGISTQILAEFDQIGLASPICKLRIAQFPGPIDWWWVWGKENKAWQGHSVKQKTDMSRPNSNPSSTTGRGAQSPNSQRAVSPSSPAREMSTLSIPPVDNDVGRPPILTDLLNARR
jgi:hypothetical protein